MFGTLKPSEQVESFHADFEPSRALASGLCQRVFTMALHFETRGDGPRPALLLHGFLGSGRNLMSLARRWSDLDPTRTLLIPDLTGHGQSPSLPNDPDLNSIALDVVKLIEEELGAEFPELIGHSLGGRVALLVREHAQVSQAPVTLIDIAPSPISRRSEELDRLLDALMDAPSDGDDRETFRKHFSNRGVGRALTDWILMNLKRGPNGRRSWRFDRQALTELDKNSRNLDLWASIDRGPTRCIRGGRSDFVNASDIERLTTHGVHVDTIVDAGHFVHVDAQSELLDLLVHRTA